MALIIEGKPLVPLLRCLEINTNTLWNPPSAPAFPKPKNEGVGVTLLLGVSLIRSCDRPLPSSITLSPANMRSEISCFSFEEWVEAFVFLGGSLRRFPMKLPSQPSHRSISLIFLSCYIFSLPFPPFFPPHSFLLSKSGQKIWFLLEFFTIL